MAEDLNSMLADALAARHALLIGQQAVTISSSSGKSASFTPATLGQLDNYIVSLRQQLGLPTGVGRPLNPRFG